MADKKPAKKKIEEIKVMHPERAYMISDENLKLWEGGALKYVDRHGKELKTFRTIGRSGRGIDVLFID